MSGAPSGRAPSPEGGPTGLRARLAAGLRDAWQVVRGISGERAYEIYLEHHTRVHPGTPPMGEREFWRRHIDRGDTDPGSRCC
ncbi:YbdD/YjiX family protein [Nocardiopsis trehalosi]|uniref:YbdD/YjiX family protein n=1 Tax=Nocardiopsis trehalosi TaxID=109329 RepID=UPI000A5642F4|nr:YbdD/YjiX family protein [Nocardiopsis trehalosi]